MKKSTLYFFLLCNTILILTFLIDLIFFYDVPFLPDSFFRRITDLDWSLFLQPDTEREKIIIPGSFAVTLVVSFINLFAFHNLIYYQHKTMVIRKGWKIAIPLIFLLLYLPFYFYCKYQAMYFRLYMMMLPAVFFSLTILVLGFVGIKGAAQKRS